MEREKNSRRTRYRKFDGAPPCDLEAERAALAVVLLEPRRLSDVVALLTPTDFADRSNRTIFEAMLRLQDRGMKSDATIVVGELRVAGLYNAEDGVSATALVDLFRLFPWASSLPHFLDRVLEMSRRRHVIASRI